MAVPRKLVGEVKTDATGSTGNEGGFRFHKGGVLGEFDAINHEGTLLFALAAVVFWHPMNLRRSDVKLSVGSKATLVISRERDAGSETLSAR
jgi:hypothetical protein